MFSDKVVSIGLMGLGTVGSGVVKTLEKNGGLIRERTGFTFSLRRVLVRDLEKPRQVTVARGVLTTDASELVGDPEIDIIVEVMGGIEPAGEYIREALQAGKHVITANKELLAQQGDELMAMARSRGVRLLFEASVAGGIPIVRMVESYLTANRILAIRGILNGTSNYILSQMEEHGQTFVDALHDAQRRGYAESNPESDIAGYDAAYKLSILANMSFSAKTQMADIVRTGIADITPLDIRAAKDTGTVIKLVAEADFQDGSINLRVGPRFLAKNDVLAGVRDVFNAVTLTADVVGELTFIGRGAGELPTASAVVEDLMDVLRSPQNPVTWLQMAQRQFANGLNVDTNPNVRQTLYLRIRVPQECAHPERVEVLRRRIADDGSTLIHLGTVPHSLAEADFMAVVVMASREAATLCAEGLSGELQWCAPFDADIKALAEGQNVGREAQCLSNFVACP